MQIKITSGIANEYMTRDVFPFAWDSGFVEVDGEQFSEILDDARFNADPNATDMPASIRYMYARHLAKLEKAE